MLATNLGKPMMREFLHQLSCLATWLPGQPSPVVRAIVMILCLGYYARQAKAERDKVHIGMTVDQVLPLVQSRTALSSCQSELGGTGPV